MASAFTPGRQRSLSWPKALEIALMGLKVRLGRSVITAVSIALACAFLAFTLAGRDLLHALIALKDPDVDFRLQRRGIDLELGAAAQAARETWLLGTSLVVCFVGVTIALLMSVTERIKEIGTIKCLGALDSFVIRMFLIEALLLGSISSCIGSLAGLAASGLMHLGVYGAAAWRVASWRDLAADGLITVVAGSVISILAALYPTRLAARMQPVEAMRRES